MASLKTTTKTNSSNKKAENSTEKINVDAAAELQDESHPEPMSRAQQRRLFASARSLGMTDQERIDLAEVILRRDVESWKDFTTQEAGRLIDAFEGFEKITWMLLSRDDV